MIVTWVSTEVVLAVFSKTVKISPGIKVHSYYFMIETNSLFIQS